MAQLVYPISDITNAVNGTYLDIDEGATPNDSDYIYSTNNVNSQYECLMGSTNDPLTGSDHIVRWRQAQADSDAGTPAPSSGGTATSYDAFLYQGGTLIATMRSGDPSNEGSFLEETYTLTSGEADNITNYADLRVRFDFVGGGGPTANRRGVAVSWIELEIPNVPTFTYDESITLTTDNTLSSTGSLIMTSSVSLTSDNTIPITGGASVDESVTLTTDNTFTSSYDYEINTSIILSTSSSIDSSVLVDWNPTITLSSDNSLADTNIATQFITTSVTSDHTITIAAGNISEGSIILSSANIIDLSAQVVSIYNESIQINAYVQLDSSGRKTDRFTITGIGIIRNIGKIR